MPSNKKPPTKSLNDTSSLTAEEEIIYSALGSQVRRELITFLYENEKAGFLDLQKRFKLKVGSLYHQLNMMKDLWEQDADKKYSLTPLGKVAYNLILLNKDYLSSSNVHLRPTGDTLKKKFSWESFWRILISFFLPRKLFQYLVSEPVRSLFEGLLIIGGLLYFSIASQTVLIGFYPLEVTEWYYSILGVFGFWLVIGIVPVAFKSLFYKRRFNPLKLLAVSPFTLVPSLLVMFLIWLQSIVSTTFLFMDGQLLIILSQAWSLPLLTTAVSQTEELTINRSSLPVLFTFYIIYVVAFIVFGIQ